MSTVHLGEVVADITVGWVGPMADEYVDAGIPFLRTLNVQPYTIDTSDVKYISPEFNEKIRKSALTPGDVVVARTGRPGTAAVIPDWLTTANCSDLVVIRPGDAIDARFLVYYLNSRVGRNLVHARNVGSVQQHFNIGAAKKLPFPTTPLPEQRRIAAVLGALDDKIELNRKMNQTLEEMAQAIFKSWFIDFDGHDDLVDSELGPIPRGWSFAPLPEFTSYLRRGLSPKYVEEDGIAVLNQKCIRDFRVSLDKARRHDPSKRRIDGRVLEPLDILINSTGVGTLGRVAQLPPLKFPVICDSHVTVVRASPDVEKLFLGSYVMYLQPRIEALGHGSTGQTELRKSDLSLLNLVRPPQEVQAAFKRAVAPIRSRMHLNDLESGTLAELRDTLLPKLISGELRVPDAEAQLELTL